MFQGDKLTMMGLGSNGSEPLFDSGIHLRWHVRTSLGYPKYGFSLYRRPHATAQFSCLDIEGLSWKRSSKSDGPLVGGALRGSPAGRVGATYAASAASAELVSTARFDFRLGWGPASSAAIVATTAGTLTITASRPWIEFRLRAVTGRGEVTLRAYDGDSLVAEAARPASSAAVTTTIRGDRFDRVVISWKGSIGIYAACWALLPKDERPDPTWTRIGDFTLPRTKAVAMGRIAYPAPHSGKNYEAAWLKMREVVRMVPSGPQTFTSTTGPDPKPTYTVKPLETLSLMGLVDTGLARMLGFYYIDTKASPTETYDYMIVGRWTRAIVGNERWVCYGLAAATVGEGGLEVKFAWPASE